MMEINLVEVAIAVLTALASAGVGGVAGGAIVKGVSQSDLRQRLIDRLAANPNIPAEVIEQIRNLPFPDVITYAKTGIDTALLHVTDPEAIAVLTALRDFLQQNIE